MNTEQETDKKPCVSSTAEYNREKCKRFYHARKARDREAHCAKQRRNGKAWRQRNKPRVAARSARLRSANKKSRQKRKLRTIEAYGVCPCGTADIDLLTVDHVGGWGNKQRKSTKRCIYNIVASEGFPPTYRILCVNCNWRDEFARRRESLAGGRAAREREYRHRLKRDTFDHYGGASCRACGRYEGDLDVLTIDHDIPCRLGRTRKYSGWRFYELLKSQGYPPGFSVMCFNCNWKKGVTNRPATVATDRRVVT